MSLSFFLSSLSTLADVPPKQSFRSLMLGQTPLTYRLQRSKRRTIGFLIDHDGLRITAPKWVGIAQIDAAICDKQHWILTRLAQQQQRLACTLKRQIQWCDGAQIAYLGGTITLSIALGTKTIVHHNPVNRCLTLCTPQQTSELQIQRHVQQWIQSQARTLFALCLRSYAGQLGVHFSGLALSSAATRWGSCSANGQIRLNWRLMHYPMPLIDYVVAHEVAHLREMNHGPQFWATVQSIYPDYVAAKKALRAHTPGSMPAFD